MIIQTMPYPAASSPVDPNFSDTWLLLGFEDGPDGSTTITDESAAAQGVADLSNTGVREIDTSRAKFGNSSITLSSFGSISWIGNTEPVLSGEFGIEAFVRNSTALGGFRGIIATGTSGSNRGFWFYGNNANLRFLAWNPAGSIVASMEVPWNPPADTDWHHVAVTRDSSDVIRMFINGEVVDTDSHTGEFRNGNNAISVGTYYPNDSPCWVGWIDEVRCYNGFCPYDAAFTPPTAPHPRS